MDNSNKEIIEKTLQALRRNNMQAYYADTKEQAKELVCSMLKKGSTVTHGGSVTLAETGITELLGNGDYIYLDRSAPGLTPEQVREIYRKSFFADTYLTSSNAITENGELYNVDGNSNRVAAIVYGPESVIVIAGYNKIVPDIRAAVERVKRIAAPKNAVRLDCATPCAETGECISLKKENSFACEGCKSPARICCNYVVTAQQRHKDRIKVIIVGEVLGY
ncbi:MAG: lactate utilization protein [Clostridia bacterium]|nr:lactate utilization protein [Clostridia bacterium]